MVTRGTTKRRDAKLIVFISLFLLVIVLMANIAYLIDVSKGVPGKVDFEV